MHGQKNIKLVEEMAAGCISCGALATVLSL